MVGHIIAALRRSRLVKDIDIVEVVEEESIQFLRVRAKIKDGSVLHVKELFFSDRSKYSYHWQTASGKFLLRWDNAPHHPEVSTHPDHKHEGGSIDPSMRISIEEVLADIAAKLKES